MFLRRSGWLAGVCVFCCVFFCGCKKSSLPVALEETYTCTVTVVSGDAHWKGDVKKDGAGTFSVKVTAPETMRGLEVFRNGEQMTLQFQGITQELPEASVEDSDFSRLFRTLHTLSQPDQLHQNDRKGQNFSYDGGLGRFEVKVGEDGTGKEFSYTDREFTVFLENYQGTS